MIVSPAVLLYDADNNPIFKSCGDSFQQSHSAIPMLVRKDDDTYCMPVLDSNFALKVSGSPPVPPPATTPFGLYAPRLGTSDPLVVGGTEDSDSEAIGNGEKFYLQQLVPGAEGDPSDKGSKVEIYWVTGAGEVEHLLTRRYVQARSISYLYPNWHTTRDGTSMVGDGTYTKIRIRRTRMGGGSPEIDVELYGYLE